MLDPDRNMHDATPEAAARLAGPGRRPLAEALAGALDRLVGIMSTAVAGDVVRLKGWPESVEPIDVAVRGRLAGRQGMVAAVGWCADRQAAAALVRPLLAVTTAAGELGAHAYLVVATPAALGAEDAALLAVLDGGEWATLPLVAEVAGTQAARVPGRLTSAPVADTPFGVDGEPWRLRAAAVEPGGGEVTVALPVAAE